MNDLRSAGIFTLLFGVLLSSCIGGNGKYRDQSSQNTERLEKPSRGVFRIAFGSCNQVDRPNALWPHVRDAEPRVWIWGGDIIYADTEDMDRMKRLYDRQREVPGYRELRREVDILGTWDDHDYGVNDGGSEYPKKQESQQLLLDFLDVSADNPRRSREGVYHLEDYELGNRKLGIVVLDTRYFRSPLKKSTTRSRRYEADRDSTSTILGEAQWEWLEGVLGAKGYDLFVVMSSIQFLSSEHGFETWGNFPSEVERMKSLLEKTGRTPVVFLSGDRHISELTMTRWDSVAYPVFDFTSSGLTHSYSSYTGEPNKFRVGEVVSEKSFGLLDIDPSIMELTFSIVGEEGRILQQNKHRFP